jgi:hypothetical protein
MGRTAYPDCDARARKLTEPTRPAGSSGGPAASTRRRIAVAFGRSFQFLTSPPRFAAGGFFCAQGYPQGLRSERGITRLLPCDGKHNHDELACASRLLGAAIQNRLLRTVRK